MEKIPLEFITTSCNRPELLSRTYASFTKNLEGIDYSKSTLYINIDPAPNNDKFQKICEIAKKYFGNVVINNPKEPNFARAVNWCTSQTKSNHVFYLEDDWELSININIHDLIKIMNNDSNIKQVQLRKRVKTDICQENTDTFGFPPGLWNANFLRIFSRSMNGDTNPEVQIINFQRKLRKNKNMVKKVIYGDVPITHDIGRWWLKQKQLTRDYGNNENKWTPWVKWKSIK